MTLHSDLPCLPTWLTSLARCHRVASPPMLVRVSCETIPSAEHNSAQVTTQPLQATLQLGTHFASTTRARITATRPPPVVRKHLHACPQRRVLEAPATLFVRLLQPRQLLRLDPLQERVNISASVQLHTGAALAVMVGCKRAATCDQNRNNMRRPNKETRASNLRPEK